MSANELDDRELMQSLKNGNQQSMEALHLRHRVNVLRLLRRMTGDSAAAEELAQEVFLRVYQARDRYQPTASFSTWLYRITFNRALNWIRAQKARSFISSFDAQPSRLRGFRDAGVSPEHALMDKEQVARVRRAIESLPSRHRIALLMHKYEGLDYAEIAAAMDTSIPAIKSLLFRTYLTLHDRLKHR